MSRVDEIDFEIEMSEKELKLQPMPSESMMKG